MAAPHRWGKLLQLGRFEWEHVIRQCSFPKQNTKLVALTIATYADTKTGENIYPGQKRLAAHTGISERRIRDHLQDLERYGLLYLRVKGSSFGRGGKGMASKYQLTVPEEVVEWWANDAEGDMDMWDLAMLDYDLATGEHRTPASGDSASETEETPDVRDRTPDVRDISPDVRDMNTGHQRPPTSSLPPHEANPHQPNPHASVSSPSVTHAREGAREKPDDLDEDLSLEDERARQLAGLRELQKKIDAEQKEAS